MDSIKNLVKIRNLSFSWENRNIFSNINIDIQREKITAIMGPSGTGKTTLLHLIGGLLSPSEGTIEINNEDVHTLSRKQLNRLRHNIGMLFQGGALFTHLTAFENVAFPLQENTQLSQKQIHDIVLEKLEAVNLAEAKNLKANQLSGGMIRRIALARAMALNPMLGMYDEPFSGLDPIALNVIANLIREVNDRYKMTTILVSHDVHETFRIADYVYLIEGESVMAQGTPKELYAHTDPRVQQFVGAAPVNALNSKLPAHQYQPPQTTESSISA